jgi:hypothetical protein
MTTPEEVAQQILDDAKAGIKRTTIDGNTVEMMTPAERQAAIDPSDDIAKSQTGGLQFRKFISQGGLGT